MFLYLFFLFYYILKNILKEKLYLIMSNLSTECSISNCSKTNFKLSTGSLNIKKKVKFAQSIGVFYIESYKKYNKIENYKIERYVKNKKLEQVGCKCLIF